MRVLAIDASVNNVGWAMFDTEARKRKLAWQWGTFKLEGMNFAMRAIDLRDNIQMLEGLRYKINALGIAASPEFLITEQPAFYSSEKGKIAAHMNYTIDLAALNWFIAGWFHIDHRHHFPITAAQWKGMVPKDVTQRRFWKRFPEADEKSCSEHSIDAVMMLYYWLTTCAPQVSQGLFPAPTKYEWLIPF